MAVYKRSYKRYEGPRTDERWRFTVLPRYTLKTLFESKIHTLLFYFGLLPHLVAGVLIYLLANLEAVASFNIPVEALQFIPVDGSFFGVLFSVETFISFFLVSLIGPGLVSPDLANNALPVYFSRPFSRVEYVLGKLSVLLLLTSLITWVPGLLLVGMQVSLTDFSWLSNNTRIVMAILLGSWIWILTISLIALAISAWVKWRPVAAASLFGIFFVAAGFGTAANGLMDMPWGTLINMGTTMGMLWRWLFLGQDVYRLPPGPGSGELPAWTGLFSMLFICAAALFMLTKKVRATQAVK